jgi:hypothetical protein
MAITKIHPGTKVQSQNFQNGKKMEKTANFLTGQGQKYKMLFHSE